MNRSPLVQAPLKVNRRAKVIVDQTVLQKEIDAANENIELLSEYVSASIPEWLGLVTLSNIGPYMFPPLDYNEDLVVVESITPGVDFAYNLGQDLMRWRIGFFHTVRAHDAVNLGQSNEVTLVVQEAGTLTLAGTFGEPLPVTVIGSVTADEFFIGGTSVEELFIPIADKDDFVVGALRTNNISVPGSIELDISVGGNLVPIPDFDTSPQYDLGTAVDQWNNTFTKTLFLDGTDIRDYIIQATGSYQTALTWVTDPTDQKTVDIESFGGSLEYGRLLNVPTIPNLDGYATEGWVVQQGYLTGVQFPAWVADLQSSVNLSGFNLDIDYTGPQGPVGPTGPPGADSTVPGPPGTTLWSGLTDRPSWTDLISSPTSSEIRTTASLVPDDAALTIGTSLAPWADIYTDAMDVVGVLTASNIVLGGDLRAQGSRIRNLPLPQADADAASKEYVDSVVPAWTGLVASEAGGISVSGNITPGLDSAYTLGDADHLWVNGHFYILSSTLGILFGDNASSEITNPSIGELQTNANLTPKTSTLSLGTTLKPWSDVYATSGNFTGILEVQNLLIGSQGAINMQNNLITNVAAPQTATDAANKQYVDAVVASVTFETLPGNPLSSTGGVVSSSGVLDMNSNKIVGVGEPTLDADATTKLYVDTAVAAAAGGAADFDTLLNSPFESQTNSTLFLAKNINLNGFTFFNVPPPEFGKQIATKDYVDDTVAAALVTPFDQWDAIHRQLSTVSVRINAVNPPTGKHEVDLWASITWPQNSGVNISNVLVYLATSSRVFSYDAQNLGYAVVGPTLVSSRRGQSLESDTYFLNDVLLDRVNSEDDIRFVVECLVTIGADSKVFTVKSGVLQSHLVQEVF